MDVDDVVEHDNDEDDDGDDGFCWWLMAMMMLALIMINIDFVAVFLCIVSHRLSYLYWFSLITALTPYFSYLYGEVFFQILSCHPNPYINLRWCEDRWYDDRWSDDSDDNGRWYDDDVYHINCHIYSDSTAYQRLLLSSAAIFLSSSFSCSTNSVHLFARFDLLYIIHHHNDLYHMNNNILWLIFSKQRLHRSSSPSSLEK